MIRLLIDKARLTSSLPALRNLPNLLRPSREIKVRNLSQAVPAGQSSQTLAKDIIVYKYDNPRFFKMMNFFAISQFFFWGYLGELLFDNAFV